MVDHQFAYYVNRTSTGITGYVDCTNTTTSPAATIKSLQKNLLQIKNHYIKEQFEWNRTYGPSLIKVSVLNDFPNNLNQNCTYFLDSTSYNTFNNTNYLTWCEQDFYINRSYEPPTPQNRLKQIIDSRIAPAVRLREYMTPTVSPQELRARETLRRLLGEDRWRRYLRDGFITAYNRKSGMSYQIYPGHAFTKVYQNGVHIQQLCVVLQGNFPPSDSVVVRYLMAVNDDTQLWKLANKWPPVKPKTNKNLDLRPLTEIYNELKPSQLAVA